MKLLQDVVGCDVDRNRGVTSRSIGYCGAQHVSMSQGAQCRATCRNKRCYGPQHPSFFGNNWTRSTGRHWIRPKCKHVEYCGPLQEVSLVVLETIGLDRMVDIGAKL